MGGKKRKNSSQQDTSRPNKPRHHVSLVSDDDDDSLAPSSRARSRASKKHLQSEDKMVASDLSSKILRVAMEQQKEVEAEDADPAAAAFAEEAVAATADGSVAGGDYEEDDDIDEFQGFAEDEYYGEELEINEEDEKVLEAFMPKGDGQYQLNLGELIFQKIKEKDAAMSAEIKPSPKLDIEVVDLYKRVGKLLEKYTSGKLPKALKIIPTMNFWEDVLVLTEPHKWSANAVYQVTRIFASNMNAKKARRFYNAILLERARHDIRTHKRLHNAIYLSLKKALYKPAAFFKGLLLPLCESGDCTLREAVIIGSIIEKVSIPVHHSSAALMKLAMLEYRGTTSYFIKLFLDKKYALPFKVIDAVLEHFLSFLHDERIMPVIWHQSLLSFVERYRDALEKNDLEKLKRLIQHQKHYLVTPVIHGELMKSKNWGDKDDAMSISAPSLVMIKAIEEDLDDIPEVPMEED